jgi:hypothetical protein
MTGETLRHALAQTGEALDEAVRFGRQAYQFGPNAYAYEALLRCATAQNAVTRLAALISDLSHRLEAFESQALA